MEGEQTSRRRGKSRGAAAQRGGEWSEGRLTGEGAISEARVAGRRSWWDGGASGRDVVRKHDPEGSQGAGEQRAPASASTSRLATHR